MFVLEGVCPRGVLSWGFVLGGFVLEGFCPRGVLSWGILPWNGFVLGTLPSPMGFCPRRVCPIESQQEHLGESSAVSPRLDMRLSTNTWQVWYVGALVSGCNNSQ